ncbi:alkyl hydroperoxide reductase [Bacillus paralicheniformis]|nr:alkyl hydroperoxide reductase [Bacillus paralicheniformis]
MKKQLLDVAIIGGGPAGLNAALVLGRARKNVAVIDAGCPRNAVTRKAHGFLTRDGISPSEFRQIAKEQISAYPSVSFIADKAVSITKTGGHFQMTTAQGNTFASKKVLFAVGMKDQPLDIPGLAEVYGKSAFVCPYCDGWELRDQPLVIITKGDEAMHFASLISGWTNRFTICTNGPPSTDGRAVRGAQPASRPCIRSADSMHRLRRRDRATSRSRRRDDNSM